jgi:hypothetical protein
MRGSLSAVPVPLEAVTIERLAQLLAHTEEDNGCWLYKSIHHTGYSYARIKQRKHGVHRILYAVVTGTNPDQSLVLDHLCRKRNCINPKHLEAVTQSVNSSRGDVGVYSTEQAKSRTQCTSGHPFDEANTYWHRGARQCLICRRRRASYGYYDTKKEGK